MNAKTEQRNPVAGRRACRRRKNRTRWSRNSPSGPATRRSARARTSPTPTWRSSRRFDDLVSIDAVTSSEDWRTGWVGKQIARRAASPGPERRSGLPAHPAWAPGRNGEKKRSITDRERHTLHRVVEVRADATGDPLTDRSSQPGRRPPAHSSKQGRGRGSGNRRRRPSAGAPRWEKSRRRGGHRRGR